MTAPLLPLDGARGPRHVAMCCAMLGALLAASPRAAAAQQAPDLVRGRVTDDSARGVVASVKITRGPDRLTLGATTDSSGAYRVRFDVGTGDYLVYVSAPGFRATRRRVQRQGEERELVADFSLARDVALLAAVKVTAVKPERARNEIGPFQLEPGSAERWNDGVDGQVPPTMAGDLNAIAGTMSNVGQIGGAPSILGSGSESNLSTLNGMGLAAGSLPRAARVETRITGATFDATRGGFSGVNIDSRLGPGSRSYQRRNAFLALDPPALQFADPTSRSLGARSGGFRASVGADGEIVRNTLTYNMALDVSRSASDPASLLSAGPDALIRAGVAPDSISRLIGIAGPLGLVLGGRGVPSSREQRRISWIGRFDDTRDTLDTRSLTTYADVGRAGALGLGALSAPSASGERNDETYGAQIIVGRYVGAGRRVLNETRLSGSNVRTRTTPYLELPGANVLIRSSGLDAARDVTGVSIGGAPYLAADGTRWSAEGANETHWNASGRRHRFKAILWGRLDGLRERDVANELGTFSFNSIADLSASRPSSFSRTLSQPERTGEVWNAATAIVHSYAPTRFFGLMYGVRLEADGFLSRPDANPLLEQTLSVRTGAAPAHVHVSPRIGFSYTYNADKNNGSGSSMNMMGHFRRYPVGVIRGGIGEFRDFLAPSVLASAAASTGLPGGTAFLSCVGASAPSPDWDAYADASAIPSQCLDGSGPLAERAPSAVLLDPSYDAPRSWRAALGWTTSVKNWIVKVDGLGSYNLSQPSMIDANFGAVSRFALPGESGRPVFVSAAAIDPLSGAVSAAQSRRSDLFGRVATRVSDLRGYGGQLTASVAPDVFRFRTRFAFYSSLSYTLESARRQYRGFDGAAFGDPREVDWAANGNSARHALVLSGGFGTRKLGFVTLFARAQSGLPFTPITQGDVNGDGRGGDRAFVPDPASETDAAVAAQLRALLASGSPTARGCLERNFGRVPERNACRGPWTQSLNMQWRPPLPGRWGYRARPTVYLQNVLAGVDQLVHGSSSLRGWGSPTSVDPVLLVPRGFDPGTRRYRYDVNARFADTRPGRSLTLNPFRLVVDFSLDLSTNYELQQLRRAVEPVRSPIGYQRRSSDSLAAFYLRSTSSIHKHMLAERDSLFLTPAQITRLERADSAFSDRVRTIYRALGSYLADANGAATKAELDSVTATQKAYWKIFWEQPEIADSAITPLQRDLVEMLKGMLRTPSKDRLNSRWQFGNAVTVADKPRAASAPR